MVTLENWCYQMELGPGRDSWRLTGKVIGHPNFPDGYKVCVSTPVEFDSLTMTLKTTSGRLYKLGNCAGNLAKQISYIKEDIERGGTLVK